MAQISIALIQFDKETQPRVQLDMLVVEDYAIAMGQGDIFPPVLLFEEDGKYWIGDGFHRCQAARKLGLAEITADVEPGGKRAAVLASCAANAVHGLRRTNKDKQRAVKRMLADPEWAQWSDTEVAKHCGVSHPFVGKQRAILKPLQDSRLVKRGDSTYLMNTGNIGEGLSEEALEAAARTDIRQDRRAVERLSAMPAEMQLPVLDLVAEGKRPDAAIKIVTTEYRDAKREERLAALGELKATAKDITLIWADCLEWMPDHQGEFDCLIADPPYNTGRMKWDMFESAKAFRLFSREWMAKAFSCLKEQYQAFIFCPTEWAADVEWYLRSIGQHPKSRIAWTYRSIPLGRVVTDRLARMHQTIFHCGNKALCFDESWDDRRFDVQSYEAPLTTSNDERVHQAQKPLDLIKWLVELGTQPEQNILDPFSGGATTGIACLDLRRQATLVEKDEDFFAIGQGRIAEYEQQLR